MIFFINKHLHKLQYNDNCKNLHQIKLIAGKSMQTVFSSESHFELSSSLSAPVLMMFGCLVISPHATVVTEIPHIPDLPHLTHLPHVTKITFSFPLSLIS